MFNDALVVQSAVSAFNNAALVAPTFFWLGLLAVPLLVMAYFCGDAFMARIGWTRANVMENSALLSVAVTLIWLIVFGGNYGVLRDMTSVLPFVVASIVFVCAVLIGRASRNIKMPAWGGRGLRGRLGRALLAVICVLFVGLSGMHTWWGVMMQCAAFVGGIVLGRSAWRMFGTIGGATFVMVATATAVLMQPEFFRFGQLGNLTIVHLVGLLAVGVFAAAAVALRNVRPMGRIHDSAFVKLKWMARFVVALALALFVLTESVPVFLGALGTMLGMFAMSVWHARAIDAKLAEYMWACGLIAFGWLATLPVIGAAGVLVLAGLPRVNLWRAVRFLL